MIADLHIHTTAFSRDSNLDPVDAIKQAKRIGLDCICFAEHNKTWDEESVYQLSSKWEFPVFHGVEVDTFEGHVLVFGLHRDFERMIPVQELRELVLEVGGVMIATHPCGGFFSSGAVFGQEVLLERAAARPVFKWVDAVEGLNGRSLGKENSLAKDVACRLNLNVVGGSDAHEIEEIGRCVTIFDNHVRNESELIAELKAGRCKPGRHTS